jgi:DNA-binding NarL/FixJ family response regulator
MTIEARLRIIIVDDHEAVREGLRWMLREDAIEIVGEASEGGALLRLLETIEPDAVLLDLSMPGVGGLEVLGKLNELGSSTPVVVLTMHDDDASVDRALGLGAAGYILKSAPRDEMLRALRAAAGGGAYVQPSLAKPLLARHLTAVTPTTDEAVAHLTPRQLQLLRAIASGRSNKELAHELGISEATVKGYLKDLYARLEVGSRAGAVAYGMRHGLIR